MKPRSWIHRIRARPRLIISLLIGCCAFFILPDKRLAIGTRLLISWDIAATLYLIMAWAIMFTSTIACMRARARQQDDGAEIVLAFTLIAACASIAAIFLEIAQLKTYIPIERPWHLFLAAFTIFCSWNLVQTSFALHYAHEFYDSEADPLNPCLDFPGNEQPDYVDFLYFSYVIGTTSQTADISITSSIMRRLGLVHCIIAFFFNTTLLALTINIAASLTSG